MQPLRIIEKCSAEVDSFLPQLFILKSDIDEFQEEMFLLQSQRQNDIWTLLERAVRKKIFNGLLEHVYKTD